MSAMTRWMAPVALAGMLLATAALLPSVETAEAAPSPAPVQDGDTDLDRALQEVEALLGELRSQPGADRSVVRRLESIALRLRRAKAEAGKASASSSSGSDEGSGGGSSATPEDFLRELSSWVTERLYRDVELRDDQRAVADDIAQRFYTDYTLARDQNDEKSKQVILTDTKARFDAYLPKRKAMTLKSNLDGLVRRWERWGNWGGNRGGGR
ncbi:MAG: hypothetical protein ACYTG4_04295 [Planctomycetota bacterium]